MLVKHSKRTIRRACSCGATDLYWAHDEDSPGSYCPSCEVRGGYVLIERSGVRHVCHAVGLPSGPGSDETAPAPTPKPVKARTPKEMPDAISGYFPRYVEGSTTDVELLKKMRANGLHILLEGPPGTGKTALAMASFPDAQMIVCCADTEDADLEGSWVQQPDGTFSWYDGPIVLAAEAGVPLIMDEVNLAPPSVLSHCLYPMMDGRGSFKVRGNESRGVITAKAGFMIIGCANPDVPGGRFSEALLSRFTLQMRFETDWSIAKGIGISDAFIRVAKNLDTKRRANEADWAPQIRDALAWKSLAETQSEAFAWRALISSAPEDDRPIVQSVVQAVTGDSSIQSLALGTV